MSDPCLSLAEKDKKPDCSKDKAHSLKSIGKAKMVILDKTRKDKCFVGQFYERCCVRGMEGELQDVQGEFLKVVLRATPFIEKQVTNMRAPVEVERRVAAILYYLSDEGQVRKTANSFGLSRSSVPVIVHRVTHAIAVHLGSK